MVVDSSPKLTHSNWIKEQSKGSDINLIIQLLKSDKLKKYVAKEMDWSGVSVLLKYCRDLFLRNVLLYCKVTLKNHQEPISQFVLQKNFNSQSDFGMSWWQWSFGNGKDSRVIASEVLLAQDGRWCVHTHITHVIDV